MNEEYAFSNMSTEEFLDTMESMILQNPDMDGIELEDNIGRTWFIVLTSEQTKTMN